MSASSDPPFNVHLDSPAEERWVIVADAPGYFVSNLGRVFGPFGLMKAGSNTWGYVAVTMQLPNAPKAKRVHRLVAQAFIPPIEGKRFVNHRNGVKSDNRVENLEWCTAAENVLHQYRVLGQEGNRGEKSSTCKLTADEVIEIRRLASERRSHSSLGRRFGVTHTAIGAIVARKTWKHV